MLQEKPVVACISTIYSFTIKCAGSCPVCSGFSYHQNNCGSKKIHFYVILLYSLLSSVFAYHYHPDHDPGMIQNNCG